MALIVQQQGKINPLFVISQYKDTLSGYFIGSFILGRLPFSSCRSTSILHIDASCYLAGSGGLKDEIEGWISTE